MNILNRLSSFILVCIGVQIVWNGASASADNLRTPGLVMPVPAYPPGILSVILAPFRKASQGSDQQPCTGDVSNRREYPIGVVTYEPEREDPATRNGRPELPRAVRDSQRGRRTDAGQLQIVSTEGVAPRRLCLIVPYGSESFGFDPTSATIEETNEHFPLSQPNDVHA